MSPIIPRVTTKKIILRHIVKNKNKIIKVVHKKIPILYNEGRNGGTEEQKHIKTYSKKKKQKTNERIEGRNRVL